MTTEPMIRHDHERRRIEVDLAETCFYAKRQQRVLGTAEVPTRWDDAHAYLDYLLDDWQATQTCPAAE